MSLSTVSISLSIITTVVVVAGIIYAHLQLREAAANRKLTFLWDFYEQYRGQERTMFRQRVIDGEVDPMTVTGRDHFLLWQDIDDLEFLGALLQRKLVDAAWVSNLFFYSPPRLWERCQQLITEERQQ